jgi:hypothetical protein
MLMARFSSYNIVHWKNLLWKKKKYILEMK